MKRRFIVVAVLIALIPLTALFAGRLALGAPHDSELVLGGQLPGAMLAQSAPTLTLPPTVTPSSTPPEPPSTPAPTATFTPGPHEYVVQAGDTCWDIAYRFGHFDPGVISAIETLNGAGTCSALRQGDTIAIPRPTATPTPVGADLTQTAVATAAPPQITLDVGPSFALQSYVVQEGDTLSSIAIIHDSSLQQICELNPLPNGIDCGACVWESPNCCCTRPIVLSAGKEINVPAPTPTPTFTPTFTGSETPTTTPTHRAPLPTYPLAGATVSGAVRLTWVAAGVLAEDEHYLVTVRNEDSGAIFNVATRQLSLDIPTGYLPNDGQTYTFVWQVGVVRFGEDGLFHPVGAIVPPQPFTWTGQ